MSHREHHDHAAALTPRFAVLTVSDSRGKATDASGDLIERLLSEAGGALTRRDLVRDEPVDIARVVAELSASADLVVVTGGTGIASRDHTVRAVRPLLRKEIPGFGELFRALSFAEIGPAAMMSAAFAGIVGEAAVFCLPGSPDACRLAVGRLIAPEARHLVRELRR